MDELIDVATLYPQHHEITSEDRALDARTREREAREQGARSLAGSLVLDGSGTELSTSASHALEGEANG